MVMVMMAQLYKDGDMWNKLAKVGQFPPEQIFFQTFTKRVDFVMREAMMMTTMLLSQRLCYDYDDDYVMITTTTML